MKHLLNSLILILLFSSAALPAEFFRNTEAENIYIKKQTTSFKQLLQKGNKSAVLGELDKASCEEERTAKMVALGKAAAELNAYDIPQEIIAELMERNDLDKNLLAADLLLGMMKGLGVASHGADKSVKNVPDTLCEKAAKLLEHSDPVIQAMADWALALRVKKLDGSTRELPEMFRTMKNPPNWYKQWQKSDRAQLTDDYARQLVLFDRHRSVKAVHKAAEMLNAKIDAMLNSPGSSEPPSAARTAYQNAKREVQSADELSQAHEAYLSLRTAARNVIIGARPEFPTEGIAFFTNPRIPGGAWNVNVPVTGMENTPLGDIYLKDNADPARPAEPMNIPNLGAGAVCGIDLHWDATRILFSYWDKPLNKSSSGWDANQNAHLYVLDLNSRKIKKLTDTIGSNDIEPCFLPDGGYVFASDRSSYGNQCAGPFTQNKRCTTLFRLDPKRADKPIAISNNKDFDRHPHVLNDGTIVFLHWEYQERSFLQGQNAWVCRPDGTSMDAFYKQHISIPYSIRDVRQVEDSDFCVATIQGHHSGQNGPIVLFNPSLGINNAGAMKLLTPGCSPIEGGLGPVANQIVDEGGVKDRGGSYISPFPLSEKCFLAGHDMTDSEVDFGIYYIDVWGNRELLYRDKNISAFQPYPLRKRKTPPIVADMVDPKATHATAFVENVYDDLPGVQKGTVKYLRISQRLMTPAPVEQEGAGWTMNHYHYIPGDSTTHHFGYWDYSPTRTVGIVDVEPNGSAYFKVPAGAPVFLQALDENYCEVRRMRTSFTLQRGELRSCAGCHESRGQTVGSQKGFPRDTLAKGPQTPILPSWGDLRGLEYETDIQPIFDRYCISCHGEKSPQGRLDFTGRKIGGFNQSYRTLFGMKPGDPTIVNELDIHLGLNPKAGKDSYITGRDAQRLIKEMQQGSFPNMLVSISDRHSMSEITQPYQFGSNKSRLITTLLNDSNHKLIREKMNGEEWLMLVTWIDQNAPYCSTVIDKSDWQKKKIMVRVPVYVPSAWIPADLNPPFLNKVNSSRSPSEKDFH